MARRKKEPGKAQAADLRSGSAEFLTFTAAGGESSTEVLFRNEMIWATQRMIAELFDCSADNVSLHLKNLYREGELNEEATVEDFSAVQREGGTAGQEDAQVLPPRRNAPTAREFFATVQNKLHYAVHGHTAAEVIIGRADAKQPHMGLAAWRNAPSGKIVRSDVAVAKAFAESEFEKYRVVQDATANKQRVSGGCGNPLSQAACSAA